ncbi:Acyl-CoA synthetase (AMP-forming)/AMP-acid ligase II [Salinihabitans flavidus]|uniref:Acyl-CoA synthetase (AMP-forming)/AMP-acid ligase II n=2 Tax=Salinihabitans flavidus TaxID=569882 RepID=A0A1H8UPM4_9RHOB|nr:Acyl-CoA synthetase (AMP-forming)/AMP-acid ligase II [Salinihabitans flavidus]
MGKTRLTWAELDRECDRIARALKGVGVTGGDRVVMIFHNAPAFVVMLFALARLGAVSVPVSVRANVHEVAHFVEDSGAMLLVHDNRQNERLPDGQAVKFVAYDDLNDGPELDEDFPDEEDLALILYTSGTTGKPKGAMLTHLNIVHAGMDYAVTMQLHPGDRALAAVPLNHVTGIAALISGPVRAGACMILMESFRAKAFLDLAEAERMTYTLMVPAMYNLCLLQPDFADRDLSCWRLGGFGGAPMPEPTIRRLNETIPGLGLTNCYGATETVVAQLITPPDFTLEKREYVGRPLPGTTALVMGPDGREMPVGEPGELWLSGPNVVKGYWRNPKATKTSFQGGFWKSGDIGVKDEDGFFRVLDRAKDMINRGGLKIYSAEVENVLNDHPAVAEAAIFAKPCPVLGERVHAAIVRTSDLTESDLTSLCLSRLSDYKVPEGFTFFDGPLPRNANGKIDKNKLREDILPTLVDSRNGG